MAELKENVVVSVEEVKEEEKETVVEEKKVLVDEEKKEEKEEEAPIEKRTLNGQTLDARFSVKLFDTSKSLFKRLSEDYDDKHENARKLQAFLDCVLPGEQQFPLVSLSRFLGLLPPWNTDGLTALRQFSRQDRLKAQESLKRERSIDVPEPDTSSFSNLFKQMAVDEEDKDEDGEGSSKKMKMASPPAGLFADEEDKPGCSNVLA
ncbi:hypothetical protein PRIPAC_96738 [Pristionchus pacificus]|uniref:Uncharacterized protein n=1 Tax=Pristionchus pacificus TaxID=54126 RepID=A0A2A6D0J4_PRIPA|nr:hypothetical protein PRIPAC_96738 [Pristionchus pacificus]|eukprot:PDM83925.1 hypothetical protein PRIPAC_34117 [Pristionchus pacificus]